jgi:xanthine dehydrogenase accessory factor
MFFFKALGKMSDCTINLAMNFETSIEFYQQFVQALQRGSVVLATIVQTQGSTPREVGAKMLICADGQIIDTIGGGAGEAKVIRQAQTVLQTGKKQRLNIDLTGSLQDLPQDSPQRQPDGICGGTMQIWLERWQGEGSIELVQTILQILTAGQSAQLITPHTIDQSPYLLAATDSPPQSQAWAELLQPPPVLLIVGAGHCGIQLAKVAHLIGFQTIIQDDRADWANQENYPQASIISIAPLPKLLDQLAEQPQLYAALLTRSYQYDLEALKLLLQRKIPCQYIGMIGSKTRVQQVKRSLLQGGIKRGSLQAIHAPIGLPIGALTPAEIAVSISAELILIRRGRS